jgi:hypothetical protein
MISSNLEGYGCKVEYSPGKWYMEVKLKVLKGPLATRVFSIDEQNWLTFGTAPECTITVADDESLAPFHFQIVVETPVVWLFDRNSNQGIEVCHLYGDWFTVGGAMQQVSGIDILYFYSEIMRDEDQIRVGDHEFQLEINMPRACVECGVELTLLEEATSRIVGEVYHCPSCRLPIDDDLKGQAKLVSYLNMFKENIACLSRRRLNDFFQAQRVRDLWLRGIFNNKDFIPTYPTYHKLFVECRILVRKFLRFRI